MSMHIHAMKTAKKGYYRGDVERCICGATRRVVKTVDGPAKTEWQEATESFPMTRGEWDELNVDMIWSITKREDEEHWDEVAAPGEIGWKEAFNSVPLDFTAPRGMSNGTHWVWHDIGPNSGDNAYGVEIKDGQFIPLSTARACLEAVARSYGITRQDIEEGREGIDHVYIEGFTWEAETGRLLVITGS